MAAETVAGHAMRIGTLIAAMALLAGCQSTAPAGETGPDGSPRATPASGAEAATAGVVMFDPPTGVLAPEQVWRVDAQDVVTHILSGATCPGMLGGLRRDKQTIYRQNGMDVGCNYIGDGPTILRFYIFTSETGGLDSEMRVASDSMRAQQPVAKRAPPSPASQAFRNYAVAEADANGVMVRNSLLMTQVNGGWILKARVTCRETDATRTEELAARLLDDEARRLKSQPVPRTIRTPG